MTGQWRYETPGVEPTTVPEYYLYDGHGSVRGILSGDGVINTSQVYNYTTFGTPIGFAPGSVLSPLLYSGEWWDPAAGGSACCGWNEGFVGRVSASRTLPKRSQITRAGEACYNVAETAMLSVIIPAFNEEKTLAQVLDRVLALPLRPQIIAVSDGSTDGTNDIIRRYQRERGITGVICPVNGGKGAAIQAGLAHATQPYTVIQDADLEYSPEQFDVLLAPVRKGKAEVVFGSRNLKHPAMRRNNFHYFRFWLGGKVVTMVANYLFAVHLTDEATCYKLFPTDLLRQMNLTCRGFDFCPEVTAKALRMGYRIHEVPIEYNPRTMDEGKKIRAWHGIEAILVLLKFRLMPWHWLLRPRRAAAAAPAPAPHPVDDELDHALAT